MDDQNSKVLSVMKERDFYHAKVEGENHVRRSKVASQTN